MVLVVVSGSSVQQRERESIEQSVNFIGLETSTPTGAHRSLPALGGEAFGMSLLLFSGG